jgi:ParB family transcriptional regulator, chromosome partitioning protein
MDTIRTTTMQPQLIETGKLAISPLNVRKTLAKGGLEDMKASILAHGLMQNLVVTAAGDGSYQVVAGGRRLEAIRSLQAEGKLPGDFAAPCQVVEHDHAEEMSLAENTVRLAMHPADQFAAFAALIDGGQTAAEVAGRFGIEESLVMKRMKLARVAPALLQEYREERLTLECLMAFTVTDDHKRQLKVYKSLQGWQKDDPAHIRACLTEKLIDASSKLARFVGLDAYAAAGGTSRADLFGDDVYLEKPALLHRLAEAKLSALRQELEAEGWGWIEINPDRSWELVNRCSRIQPRLIDAPAELIASHEQAKAEMESIEQALEDTESDALLDARDAASARLDAVQEQLSGHVGFAGDQKALAGCFVSIGQDGTPFIDKGLVKPEQRKQLARLQAADGGDEAPAPAKPRGGIPETLRRDLAACRLQAARAEIASHPAIAFDLLVFKVACETLDPMHTPSDGPDVMFREPSTTTPVEAKPATARLDALRQSLPVAWLKPKSESGRFDAFRTLAEADKLGLLAYCLAMTLKPKLAPAAGDEPTAYDAALSLTGAEMADYWRPAKESYLKRVNRDQLLSIARETLGEAWAQSRWKDAKASLVDQLDRAFGDPGKGRAREQAERLKRWLPAGMAFAIPAEPKAARAKKARKAA